MLNNLTGTYALVAKVDVSNIEESTVWYESKLDLVVDSRFGAPNWAQLSAPGVNNFSIGLNLDAGNVGTGGAATTFVVEDIEEARNALISRGVKVGAVQNAGDGVMLAFFSDPDGNSLGLRQN